MAYEALKEVTEWKVSFKQPNHTYLIKGDKIVAYIPWHTEKPVWGTPMKFDRRYRKFVKADVALFDLKEQADPNTKIVKGSKGAEYTVNIMEKTCSCPGFKFRDTCKHLTELVDN